MCGFEHQIRCVQKKVTLLSGRRKEALARWTWRTCFKSRKAARWVATVTFWPVVFVKQQSQTWFTSPVSREAFQFRQKAPGDSWQPPTWSRCARLLSTLPCFALLSGTMKSSAVVGNPGSTVIKSCSSLIPVTFNTDTKSSEMKMTFLLKLTTFGLVLSDLQ